MPASPVSIEIDVCNQALAWCRKAPHGSLEDGTLEMGECKRHYIPARDAALRAREWNFAEEHASLPAASTAPAFGFVRAFDLPADCVAVRAIQDAGPRDWRVKGRQIHSDLAAPLKVIYTTNAAPVATWDALFKNALALTLASMIAPRLVGANAAEKLAGQAEAAMEAAGTADSEERAVEPLPDTEITAIRGYGAGGDALFAVGQFRRGPY